VVDADDIRDADLDAELSEPDGNEPLDFDVSEE
jgi:hypothetical protein